MNCWILWSIQKENRFMQKEIAPDILEKISADFNEEEIEEVTSIVRNICLNVTIVGPAQLVRSLLYLCEGDLPKLKEEYIPMMRLDPPNVLLAAERKAKNPGLLYLCEGDLPKLKEEYIPMMRLDPPNVLLAAERKAKNPGHYFTIPFEEIEIFFEAMYGNKDTDEPAPDGF